MNKEFMMVFMRFAILVAAILAVLLVGIGSLILFFPHLVWTVLSNIIGGVFLLCGLVTIGGLLHAWRKA